MKIKFILNCSGHPLAKTVIEKLEKEGCVIETVPIGMDLNESISDQVRKRLEEVKLFPLNGTVPFAVTLPGLSEITAFLLAQLHGKCGFFPKILQIRKSKLGVFEIFEKTFSESIEPGVIDLDLVRKAARRLRF